MLTVFKSQVIQQRYGKNTKSAIKTIRRISRETKVNKIRKQDLKKALKKNEFDY